MEVFTEYIDKLRDSGLRPTKQRLMISKLLFGQKGTFHFTIDNLSKQSSQAIGLGNAFVLRKEYDWALKTYEKAKKLTSKQFEYDYLDGIVGKKINNILTGEKNPQAAAGLGA